MPNSVVIFGRECLGSQHRLSGWQVNMQEGYKCALSYTVPLGWKGAGISRGCHHRVGAFIVKGCKSV